MIKPRYRIIHKGQLLPTAYGSESDARAEAEACVHKSGGEATILLIVARCARSVAPLVWREVYER